jgi:hypothetical protein
VSRTPEGAVAQNGTAASNSPSRMSGSWSGINDLTGYEVGRKSPVYKNRSSPGIGNRSLTSMPSYEDTFYVRNLKGVGRVYQQTFIDTYAKVAWPSSMIARRRSRRPIF